MIEESWQKVPKVNIYDFLKVNYIYPQKITFEQKSKPYGEINTFGWSMKLQMNKSSDSEIKLKLPSP